MSCVIQDYEMVNREAIEFFESCCFQWPSLFHVYVVLFRFTELYVVYIARADQPACSSASFNEYFVTKEDFDRLRQVVGGFSGGISRQMSKDESSRYYGEHYLMDCWWHQDLLSKYRNGEDVTEYCSRVGITRYEDVEQPIVKYSNCVCDFSCDNCGNIVYDDDAYHCIDCFQLGDRGTPSNCYELCDECWAQNVFEEHETDNPGHRFEKRQMLAGVIS